MLTLQVATADNWVLVYVFTTGTLEFYLAQLLEMLPQWELSYSEVAQLQLQKLGSQQFGFDNMGLFPTSSDFICYGKT